MAHCPDAPPHGDQIVVRVFQRERATQTFLVDDEFIESPRFSCRQSDKRNELVTKLILRLFF